MILKSAHLSCQTSLVEVSRVTSRVIRYFAANSRKILTSSRFAMSKGDGMSRSPGRGRLNLSLAVTKLPSECARETKQTQIFRFSVTNVSSESAHLEKIPLWDCKFGGICVLYSKTQWDNFLPGSKIYYYENSPGPKNIIPLPNPLPKSLLFVKWLKIFR